MYPTIKTVNGKHVWIREPRLIAGLSFYFRTAQGCYRSGLFSKSRSGLFIKSRSGLFQMKVLAFSGSGVWRFGVDSGLVV